MAQTLRSVPELQSQTIASRQTIPRGAAKLDVKKSDPDRESAASFFKSLRGPQIRNQPNER
jgi:hypothetical protein